MSVKNAQKQLSQTLGKKRKSCFEITRVAFQNLSEEDTDGDDNFDAESVKETEFCEKYFSGQNFIESHDDISNKTRFKVLKAAYVRGRWSCNDSLENSKDDHPLASNFECCQTSDCLENELHSSLKVLNLPDGKTYSCSDTLLVDSSHTIPDLLGHRISENVHLYFNINNTSIFQSKHELKKDGGSIDHSVPLQSFENVVEPDVTNTCRKVVDQSVECFLVGNHKKVLAVEESHDKILSYQKGSLALLSSSENISEKISKALDLAKEHVILTAHGEIERLKDKIFELQSTVKKLEEENMQLRKLDAQHHTETYTVVTEDLIDFSDD